jgi:aquaporin Z
LAANPLDVPVALTIWKGAAVPKYLTEFIGTFFLTLTACLTVTGDRPIPALAIGATLMVMVYMGGHVSGAHYNPAVSLALLLRKKFPSSDFVPYVIAQLLGAIAAAWVAYIVVGRTIAVAPGSGISSLSAVLVEALFTFALALTVLNVACSEKTKGNSYYGLAIGFAIVAAAFAGGWISGGAFNPAVGTGPNVINALFGGGTWSNIWIYFVGPLTGGVLASVVFGIQEGAA